ncbi:MAG: winged helix-turn-helix transcriptional regulator [Eubacterium sp.]|nr:winged helix-turn-helix transcriptional regulator [Eubacterium sp.]
MDKVVYSQSVCLMNEILEMYYLSGMTQQKIAARLNLSKPTVSRLLKSAEKNNMLSVSIREPYLDCLKLQKEFSAIYPGIKIYVVPVLKDYEKNHKMTVAIEGARHVQRMLQDNQTLGVAWGGTIHYMIQTLNPCQKKNISVVTLHGEISRCGDEYDVDELVKRAAMSLGGKQYIFGQSGYFPSEEALRDYYEDVNYKKLQRIFEKIDLSVIGAGCWGRVMTSPLTPPITDYISPEEFKEIQEKDVAADIMLHYVNRQGEEIDSEIRKRTLSIDLDIYRKIPCKIALLSGVEKVKALQAVINGGYADVIYCDYELAKKLYYM